MTVNSQAISAVVKKQWELLNTFFTFGEDKEICSY